MADFFNRIKKELDKGAKVISTHSNSMIESNKVRAELSALKKSKAQAFAAIGKKIYKAADGDTLDIEVFDLVAGEIKSLKEYDASIIEKEEELSRIAADKESKLEEIKANEVQVEDELDLEAEEAEEVEIEIDDDDEEEFVSSEDKVVETQSEVLDSDSASEEKDVILQETEEDI